MSDSPAAPTHGRKRFTGRDPLQQERPSTPLELLYDLTIVVAFGTAADELAHFVAEGHLGLAVLGYTIAAFSVSWAWLNYSWFASAYDTEDWIFRLATMLQMVGVVVLSLGLPPFFSSIVAHQSPDTRVVIAGYIVMRVPLLFLWWQVSRHDRERAPAARAYMRGLVVAQTGWVLLAVWQPSLGLALVALVVLLTAELSTPYIAEQRAKTPWHPRHITERYNLLLIISLGEVVLGTVAALNAVVHGEAGWSVDAALLAFAGIGMCFATWWMYFSIPWAEPLVAHRERGFAFGYGHLVMFAAVNAMGAGLHVAAYQLEGEGHVGHATPVAMVAVSFGIFGLMFFALSTYLLRAHHPFHWLLLVATLALLALGVALAAAGAGTSICLCVIALAPVVSVVGYEALGHRHIEAALAQL